MWSAARKRTYERPTSSRRRAVVRNHGRPRALQLGRSLPGRQAEGGPDLKEGLPEILLGNEPWQNLISRCPLASILTKTRLGNRRPRGDD